MSKMPLSELTYTVVDTETTGYSPKYANLVEIAAIKVKPVLCIDNNDTFSSLINPGQKIGYDTYKIHGISNEMVANKPFIGEIIPQFAEFTKNTIIVAHNARFDMGFIEAAMQKNDIKPSHVGIIDTVKLAKKAFPGYSSYSLDAMIEMLKLKADVDDSYRHRALFDAAHTAMLLIKSITELNGQGIIDYFDL